MGVDGAPVPSPRPGGWSSSDGDYERLLDEFKSGQELLREAELRFKLLVETIPGAVYVAEPGEHGEWSYISPRLRELCGFEPEEWIAEPEFWTRLIHPDDRARVIEDEANWAETTGGVHIGEYRLRGRDGRYRWIRDAATARPGRHPGEPAVWFGVLTDITESKDAEDALRYSEQLLRSVLETAQDAFLAVDEAGDIVEWNPRAQTMFGHRADDVLGRPFVSLLVPEHARGQQADGMGWLPADAHGTPVEFTAVRADGTEIPTELTIWPTTIGPSRRYNAFLRDITERKRMQDELRALAFSDALTGLANRALLTDRLEHALAAAVGDPGSIAVLFLDIDDFKTVNDSLGHAAGDRLLTITADRLRECVGPAATVARFAGDEFAAVLPDITDELDALAIAERIGRALRDPFELEGRLTVISASIGVAVATGAITTDEMFRNADAAMYHAKRSGKNRAAVYDAGMHAEALARLELKADLRLAVDRRQLLLNYQPYLHLGTGRLCGFEALIRWRHPELGLIPPADFIPLAEETGLIQPIGDWVLLEACRHAQAMSGALDGGPAPAISVNVSAMQVQQPDFSDRVARALRGGGLPPERLVLELTEGVLLRGIDETVTGLQDLRALGVRIAIDDFGTGYSSLNYLQHLPVDILKIDKSFVDHVGAGQDATSMARVIVQIARALGLEVIAEGVERAEQVAALQAIGCDLAQGFHLSRPLEAEAALLLARDGASRLPAGPT